MRIVYFDLVIHFGGAAQCMAETFDKLKKTEDIHVLDAFGVSTQYLDTLAAFGIPCHVLYPEATRVFVGHRNRPLARFVSLVGQTGSFLKLRHRLIRKILELDPDVLCTCSRKAMPFLATSRRLRKYPIVFYAQGWYRREQVPAYNRWLIRHRARRVFTVSEATSQAIQDWGVPEEKISVVYNAVRFEEVHQQAVAGLRGPLPGNGQRLRLVVPGTLLRTKGQHTAITAVHLLKQKGLDVILWLAGDAGTGNTNAYVDYLKQLIADYSLQNNVFLLGWRNDIPAVMKEADLVVCPTHTEGFPRVVREAMLLRRPVISTPRGGVPELVVDGETGLLAEVDDAEGFARQIVRLMSDTDLRTTIAENAYAQLMGKFSIERHVALMHSALAQVASCGHEEKMQK